MANFFEIIRGVFDDLGELQHGTTTSAGSTTTIVDTGLKRFGVDDLKYGTILLPETEEAREIVSLAPATGTLTFQPAATAPDSGDGYEIAGPTYPLEDIKRIINARLSKVYVPKVDESLSLVAGTLEYALPAGIAIQDVRRIYVARSSTDGAQDFDEIHDWWPMPGSDKPLILRSSPLSGSLAILYMGSPDALTDDDDELDAEVPFRWLVAESVYRAFLWHRRHGGVQSKALVDDINHAREEAEALWKRAPIMDPGPSDKMIMPGGWDRSNRYGPWNPRA